MSFFSRKKDKKPENFEDILKKFDALKHDFNKLVSDMEALKKDGVKNLKKFGIVRFNPFSEIGSNQSFSIVVMDEENNGFVITSLFTRNENRVYGKPIKNGVSEYQLTDEEKEAIKKAQIRQ